MDRRRFLLVGAALLAGCAAPGAMSASGFRSDRITVMSHGSGPDVVLVPGMGSSPKVWADLIRALPGYRYHLVQVKGFAGHAPGANASGPVIAPVTEEIARYIRERRLKRPAVIGHSLGGTVVLGLAARHDLVSRVMAVDMLPFLGVLFGPPGTTAESIKPTADALRAAALAATPEARRKTVEANIATMVKPGPLLELAIADALASDRQTMANAYHELIVTDLRPELAKIRVPVTVLHVKTPGVPLNEAQFDALYRTQYAAVPGAHIERISDSLHFIMYDQPLRFAAAVRTFLSAR